MMLGNLFWMMAGAAFVGAKGLSSGFRRGAEHQYFVMKGFNQKRQYDLEMMVHSYDDNERKKFDDLGGHPFDRNDPYAVRAAVREIAKKEGWTYYDIKEVFNDSEFRRIIGAKKRPWER